MNIYLCMYMHIQLMVKRAQNTYKDRIIILLKMVEAIVELYGRFHGVDSREASPLCVLVASLS